MTPEIKRQLLSVGKSSCFTLRSRYLIFFSSTCYHGHPSALSFLPDFDLGHIASHLLHYYLALPGTVLATSVSLSDFTRFLLFRHPPKVCCDSGSFAVQWGTPNPLPGPLFLPHFCSMCTHITSLKIFVVVRRCHEIIGCS